MPSPLSDHPLRATLGSLAVLPNEVLMRIASYCDVKSARSFALTCRALQQPGESRVWRHLKITSAPYTRYTERIVSKLFFRKSSAILRALQRVEQRIQYVSSADLAIVEGVDSEVIERADSNVITVISLIRSKVSSLCLHEIRGSPARSTPCALEKLNFRLCGSNMLFGALTDLTLASDFDDDLGKVYGYISGIASLATRLETLRLYCPLGFYHDQLNKDKASFPGVRRLIIEMRESGRQTVDIVKLFPHLERFDLSEGTSVRPSVEVAQAFFKVLGGLKRLDSLAWAYNSIPSFREYTEGSSSNALRSLKCVSDLQDEAVRLELIDLPGLPGLERIYYVSRPNSHSVTTTRPDKISGRKSIKRIPLSVLEKIRANPELKVIAIGRSWFSKAFIEPSLWGTDNDASGVLFRTYAKCRLRLTHTRLLSQHRRVLVKLLDGIKYELPNGIVWRQWRDEEGYRWEERFHRQQGLAWEDAVDFEGERVPEDVMEHSFEAAGMSWLWQEPGRNLTLPEAVWTELEKWLSERKSFRDAQGGAGGVCDEDEEDDEGEDYNLNNIKQHEMEQEEADWQAYKESRGKIEWDEDESEE